jgi:hypothetical protein
MKRLIGFLAMALILGRLVAPAFAGLTPANATDVLVSGALSASDDTGTDEGTDPAPAPDGDE